MIDTLRLRLADPKILPGCKLFKQPPAVRSGTGHDSPELLWHQPGGSDPVFGKPVPYHAPGHRPFVVTFWRNRSHDSRRPSTLFYFVQLSVPKFAAGTNSWAVDKETTGWAVNRLEKKLLRAGIETDIMKAIVVRLDCFANVESDEPFDHYLPLFRGLDFPRTARTRHATSLLWHNSQYEIAIYDKRAEVQHRRESVADLPDNVIRFEYRLKTPRRVYASLKLNTVQNLLDNYDVIRDHFKQTLKDNLFPYAVEGLNLSTGSQIEAEMLAFKKSTQNWFNDYLYAKGARSVEKRMGRSGLKRLVEQHLKGSAHRTEEKLRKLRMTLRLLRPAKGSRRLGDLLDELKRKLFGEEASKIEL
jgi:hypothetical protein